MNTSTPLLGTNLDDSNDSKSDIQFLDDDVGMLGPTTAVTDTSTKFPELGNNNQDEKMISTNTQQEHQHQPLSMTRKLIRTDSTYEDDSFDESIRDLSHLSRQRYILRQQWFRKNNLVSRLRRSTSTASNSSSSSSGISSNIYSNSSSSSGGSGCNSNNANTSSFASSFSSSFSQTLSSLSESCDNVDYNNCCSNVTNISMTNENDYPKILRKSSFKNKLNHCYKPYFHHRPRRFSLQLLKNNLEFPESLKLFSNSNSICSGRGTSFHLPRATSSSMMMKYSSSCYSFGNNKDHNKRCIYASVATQPAGLTNAVKSNPSSPNKNNNNNDNQIIGGFLHLSNVMTTNSNQANITQVIIDPLLSSGHQATSTTPTIDEEEETNQQQTGNLNNNNSCGMNLIRSKSLDDLQTLFCCPNSLLFSTSSNFFIPEDNSNYQSAAIINSNLQPQQQQQHHYSSFNRIDCDPKNNNQTTITLPLQHQNQTTFQQQCPSYFSMNPTMTPPPPPSPANNMGFNNNNNNNNTIINDDGNQIIKQLQISIPSGNNDPTNNNNNINSNNNNNQQNNQNDSTTLCDIDHVMKKISSLRV